MGGGGLFLCNLMVARNLATDDFGLYSTLLSITTLGAILAGFGLPASAQKFIPEYRAKDQSNELTEFLDVYFRHYTVLVTSLLAAYGLVLFDVVSIETAKKHALLGILVLCAGTITWLWQRFYTLAHDKVFSALLPREILFPLLFLAFLFFFRSPDLYLTLHAHGLLLLLLSFAGLLFAVYHNNHGVFLKTGGLSRWADYTKKTFPMSTSLIVNWAGMSWDIILVGFVIGYREAGLYAVALKIALLVGFSVRVINVNILQNVSSSYYSGDLSTARKLCKNAIFYSSISGILLFGLVVALGKQILAWHGDDFVAGYWILIAIGCGRLFHSAFGPAISILNMLGWQKRVMHTMVQWIAISLVLNLILARYYGALGVAIVSAMCVCGARIELYLRLRGVLSAAK